ncbi:MAG: M3 family oligoendopeptidase [Clostridiales bacterium GWF2_38_85]|nr:MAG: M3 family oligoendopeptidase [Clostridiales bacterium GWF2_38_85]HBL84028.1 M3 family oligoendopeptidase [Clostridiales bacterium]
MKFSEIKYLRPNLEEFIEKLKALTGRLIAAESFYDADAIFDESEALSVNIETMFTIAMIRHNIDTTDKFYDDEAQYIDEKTPIIEEVNQSFIYALYNSKFKPEFEKKYGSLIFKRIEIALKTFSPEIIEELQEENKLITEYGKLLASAQIMFNGELRTLSQMTPYKQSPDDTVRRAAWEAEGSFYIENGEKLDKIYDELVHLRDKIAKKLGYKNYIELGYYRLSRDCYNKDDVELFRKSVREHLVPVAAKLYQSQAKRLGVEYPMNFADAALNFRLGNPKPQGSPDDILNHSKKFYHELSGETTEFINHMFDDELFDVLSKKGKAGGDFCTFLPAFKSPFIFANFNGTAHDVEVMTHEAGHAFAFYTAKDIYPSAYRQPTLESCEVHSMTMEFFAWSWAEGYFGKDTNKFKYNHIGGALTFIPYGTMVDHFQHIVFENPDLTPAQRHEEWTKLLGIYMPWMKLGEIAFYGDGKGWQRQMHIYQRPFYYIDYCLAQTVALQYWAMMQTARNEAWERYMRFVTKGGTKTFTELVDTAGLVVPFGDVFGGKMIKTVTDWIENFENTVMLE